MISLPGALPSPVRVPSHKEKGIFPRIFLQTEPAVIRQMQSAGSASYVSKESAVEELCGAIEEAVASKADPLSQN